MISKRLKREYEQFSKECPEVCTGGPVEPQNLLKWNVTLFGPKGTPYEGGNFKLSVEFPNNYPFHPP